MAFRGDASQIPISNIVQALFMNSQEGVLSVEGKSFRRNISVLKLGIRPLATSPGNPDLLKAALVREKIVTESEFQNAISTWNPTNHFPGDFLIRRGVITADQVGKEIRKQLEEFLFEVFLEREIHYEFKANQECADLELFDPNSYGNSLIYNVNGVLMETVRREDDWIRFQEVVRSDHEIFTAVAGALPASVPQGVDVPDRNYKLIRKSLTGEKTIEKMLAELPLSRYEVHNALFALKTAGHIRELEPPEKEELAAKLRRTFKSREAITIYESILADDPSNVRARTELIGLLEKAKSRPEQLIKHYAALIESCEATDARKARGYAEKLLQIDPDHLPAHQKIILLNARLNRRDEALLAIRALLKSIKSAQRPDEGSRILLQIIEEFPEEPLLYHEAAELLLSVGRKSEAVGLLKTVATLHERRQDISKLRKTYELLSKLAPGESGQVKRILHDSSRPRTKLLHVLRTAVISGILMTFLAIVMYLGYVEILSRTAFAESRAAISTHLKYCAFDRAKKTFDEFESAFPITTLKKDIEELREEILSAQAAKQAEDQRRLDTDTRTLLSALARAEKLIQEGGYETALKLLTETYETYHGRPGRQLHEALAQAQKRASQIHAYILAAAELEEDARRAEKRHDYRRTHAILTELVLKYPHSPAAKSALLPIRIASIPENADVFVDKIPQQRQTPTIVKLPADRQTVIHVARRGYLPHSLRVNPLQIAEVRVELRKGAEWTFQHGAPSEGFPAATGQDVLFSNRDGVIFCLDMGGNVKWRFEIPEKADVAGGLGLWRNLVYVGAFDGMVYTLDVQSGVLEGQPIPASSGLHPIKHAPSQATPHGMIVVNCGGRLLSGISLVERNVVWSQSQRLTILGRPQVSEATVYAFAAEGKLLKLDLDSGRAYNAISLLAGTNHSGTIVDGRAFVGLISGLVQAVDLASGKTLWTTQAPAGITAPLTVSLEHEALICPISTEELVCLDPKTGSERWRVKTMSSIENEGLVFRNKLMIGTRDGQIMCRDVASGDLIWDFKTAGASESPPRGILCRGIVHQDRFFQASDDGAFYCLSLD
ncbi:MAG: PQQ-binding-like beta-propeller repeat protein [Planctomycetes bacterium]|nr:PQQ-binding-like beta-propeller repeat protein [Planctomycetota bacterium]